MRSLRSVVAALLLMTALTAHAVDAVAQRATVLVNGLTILTLRTPSVTGATPSERAQMVAATIGALPYFGNVQVQKVGNTHVILAAGERVVTITPQEAKAQGSTTAGLASAWAARLRKAFVTPPLKIAEPYITLPAPSVKTIRVLGYEWANAYVSSTSPDVATAVKTTAGLRVRAVSPGTARITVQSGSLSQSLDVTVQPYAAQLPQTLNVNVAGSPALASTVQGAMEAAIRHQLQKLPNARVTVEKLSGMAIGEGQARTVTARVKVEAPDAFSRVGNVSLLVRNLALPSRKEAELWYSNDPENVNRAGPLFSATLRPGTAARLLYHHMNTSSYGLFLRAQVVNTSDVAAKVLVIPGDAPPDRNPVRAGLRAADQFFRAWASGSGEVVTIPPRSTLPISLRRMAPQETVSGLCTIRLLEGPDKILVRTDAWPPFNLERRWQAAVESSTPWREVGCNPITEYDNAPYDLSDHVYPNPFKTASFRYEVGKRYGFFKIGERPISGADERRVLDGNFGVVYTIKAEMTNPTSAPADVELVFETSAGYSAGLFLVNGRFVGTPLMQPKAEFQLGRYRLAPGQTRQVEVVTIPLSGSSYPALLSIRPVQPLSAGVPPDS